MKIKSILLIAAICLTALSCSENTSEEEQEATEEVTTEVVEEVSIDPLDGLKLNDGEKWQVDSTTNEGMIIVDSLVKNFEGEDYVTLGTNIKSELGSIIDQCKMKGEDHEQYHIVLHAMMKESKALKSGESESLEEVERYSSAYFQHFEL